MIAGITCAYKWKTGDSGKLGTMENWDWKTEDRRNVPQFFDKWDC